MIIKENIMLTRIKTLRGLAHDNNVSEQKLCGWIKSEAQLVRKKGKTYISTEQLRKWVDVETNNQT